MLNSKTWRRALLIQLLGAFCLVALAAQANPYDKFRGRSYSNQGYLSEADELKLADEVHKELSKQLKFGEDSAVNNYVESLGQKLVRNSARANIPFRFYVVNDDSLNAFATLGGRVYVHTGLLKAVETEGQLASVIGHEIGHIAARHGLDNVKRAQKYGVLAGIATVAGAVLGGQTGAQIGELAGNLLAGGYLMKHSREAEREADYLGLYDLERTRYNTGGMIEMFELLKRASSGSLGSILASHPPPAERAENTRREIGEKLGGSDQRGTANTNEFQRLKERLPAPKQQRVRPRG